MRFDLTGRCAICTLGGMSDDQIDIKALRESYQWTQEQLADALGLDRSSVSRMETGQEPKGPTKILLRKLAENAPAPAPESAA